MGRIEKDKRMLLWMVHLYCDYNHSKDGKLCEGCSRLIHYSYQRISKCSYGEKKTSCRRCKTPCYNPFMKRKIKAVMRFSGPRVLFHHPFRWMKNQF